MASLKSAIKSKCKDCTYDPQQPGTYLQQIEECTVRSCALWPVRPVTVATITLRRSQKPVDIDALVANMEDEDEVEA